MHQALWDDLPEQPLLRRREVPGYLVDDADNCGYNKAFLNAHMKDFVEKTKWDDEENNRGGFN
jgi:hypothetical protein